MTKPNRKRVLLLQTPTSHHGAGEKVYPLGLARLSSCVPDTMDRIGLDLNLAPDPWPALDEVLEKEAPDVVAMSFRNIDPLAGHQVSYVPSLVIAARLIRHRCPRARIFAGGPAFSLFAKRLMELVPEIDAAIVGEAEPVFTRLLSDAFPGSIPGVVLRDKGKIRQNRPGPGMPLEALLPLDTELFPPLRYLKKNRYVAAVGIEGKRGCDLSCGYCVYPKLGGCRMRLRPPGRIVDEMETLNQEHGVSMFHFTDAVLNRPVDHFESLCREILGRGLKVGWTGFFREDTLSPGQLEIARDAGLAALYFSGDALSRNGLKFLNKRMEPEDLLRAARITADTHVLTMCHFMANLPGETESDFHESLRLLERLLDIHAPAGNLGAVIFNPVRLYPGAPITTHLIRSGKLSASTDLLYPVYYNPPESLNRLHELDTLCQSAGVFSRLKTARVDPEEIR